MPLLRLLSRVAFICNICFLLASIIQQLPNPPEGGIVSLVIVLGFLLSIFMNVIVNGWLIIRSMIRRLEPGEVPRWLIIVNLLFFITQLILIIKGNDSFHT